MEQDNNFLKANRIWKMLDEMAENNPKEYETFIKKQISKGHESFVQPKLRFFIQVTLKVDKTPLLIYFCEWNVITEPKSEDSPINIKCGEKFETDGICSISLGFHSKVFINHSFPEIKSNVASFMFSHDTEYQVYQFVWLGLHCLEKEKHLITLESLSLSNSSNPMRPFINHPSKILNTENIFKSIGFIGTSNKKLNHSIESDSPFANSNSFELSTLKKLINLKCSSDTNTTCANQSFEEINETPILLSNNLNDHKRPLIEEILSDDQKLEKSVVKQSQINWHAKVICSNNKPIEPDKLRITFKLPGVKSGNDCNLDMYKDRLSLRVNNKYSIYTPLDLRLPCTVDETLANATFKAKQSELIVTVSILTS